MVGLAISLVAIPNFRTAGIRKVFAESPKEFDPRKYLAPARSNVKDLVRHKVKNVLCCAGHAFD